MRKTQTAELLPREMVSSGFGILAKAGVELNVIVYGFLKTDEGSKLWQILTKMPQVIL